jgi:TP901 family phage tail tape measure protein
MADINTKATVEIEVNSQSAKKKLAELETKMADLNKKKAEFERTGNTVGLVKTEKEIQKVNRQLNTVRTNAQKCEAALQKINSASPKELRMVLKQLQNDLNHIERGSAAWKAHIETIKRVKAEIKTVDAELREHEGMLSRINRKVNEWGMSIASATAAFTGIVFTARQAVQAYADMEGEMANVRKYTGMSAAEVESLNKAFKGLDTRTSREDLNKLAQEAGRLGLQSQEDVLGFVKAANQINVALDDLGDGATLTLSKLTDIFGDKERLGVEDSLLAVGSVISVLSQNCTASAPYLAQFAQRMAGVGKQANMTIPEIMGFAAVLDSQGQAVEMSATALSQLIMKLFQDPAKIATATGMDLQAFNKVLKEDTNEALLMLFDRLHSLGDMSVLAPVFSDMGTDGARASQVIAALAGNVATLRWEQGEANKAFKEGTSVTNEYNVQNSTVQARLDKAKKGFHEMAVELGEKLAPAMKYAITGTSAMMRVVSTTVTFLSDYAGTIISTASAYGIYVVATNAALIVDKVKLLWNEKLIASFKRLWTTIATNPWGAVAVAVGVVIGLLIDLTRRTNAVSAAESALNDVRKDARKKIVDEQTELEILIDAANDTTQSYEDQKKAVDKLNKTIPGFNGKIDATTRAFSYSKKALDDYINSLIHLYEVEGGKEKFKELGKEMAELKIEKRKVEKDIATEKGRQQEQNTKMSGNFNYTTTGGAYAPAGVNISMQNSSIMTILENKLDNINGKIKDTKESMEALKDAYGKDWYKQDKGKPNMPVSSSGFTPTNDKAATAEENKRQAEERKRKAEEERQKRIAEALEKKEFKVAMQLADSSLQLQLNEAKKKYKDGIIDYENFLNAQYSAQKDHYETAVAVYKKFGLAETKEYEDLKAKWLKNEDDFDKAIKKNKTDRLADTRDSDKIAAEMEFYNPNNPEAYKNQRLLNEKLAQINLEYLRKFRDEQNLGSKEYNDAQRALDKATKEEELRKRKQLETDLAAWLYIYTQKGAKERMEAELLVVQQLYEQKRLDEKEFQEAKASIERKYRDVANSKTGTKAKNQDADDVKLVYEQQLASLEDLHNQKLISQEDYESRKFQIVQNYHNKIVALVKDQGSEWALMMTNLVETWKAGFEDLGSTLPEKLQSIANIASASFAIVNAGIQSYTSYANASRDLELAKVEKQYKAQIEAKRKTGQDTTKLEEEQKKKEAAIKSKYNKQAMVIELAQAVASTALAAINAYSSAAKVPGIGYIIAPIAASMATAAGALQIATIKKQHQAQAMGYYDGGFTRRDNDNWREVGVVHANEFVANHEAVANPQLRPLLRLIDQAQRNNTVGSLTSEDVSRVIGRGAVFATPASNPQGVTDTQGSVMAMVAASMDKQAAATNELNARLANGIESFMVMDGERGFERSWRHYQRMKNNPKR